MSIFLNGVRLNKRGFIIAAVSIFSFLSWYYLFPYHILKFIVDETTKTFYIYNASFNFLLSFALILSTSFIRRIDKTSVMYAWSIFSSLGTILIILTPNDTFRLAIYLLLAVLFGMGLLAYLTYLWNLTVPEERGRVAGLIESIFLPIFPLVYTLVKNLDFLGVAVSCIVLNLGILITQPLNPKKISMLTEKKHPIGSHPERRTFLLYSIPWIIFSLINAILAKAVSFHTSQLLSSSSFVSLVILQTVGGSLGAITGGVIADLLGRRPSLAFGLTLYGISSAISGLAKSYEAFLLSFFGTGMTWGILSTLYLFVIWGDLVDLETCTHRYSFGLAIFYLATGTGFLLSLEILQIPLFIASITSCFLIFVSNIPVFLAPELLPLDFKEKIRLKFYIYLIRRKKPKYLSNHG